MATFRWWPLRDEAGGQGGREYRAREDGQLGPQDRQAARDGGERGADHAGGVLAAHHEHPEYPERHHGEDGPGQADADGVDAGRAQVVLAGGHRREQRADADHQHDRGRHGVYGRPQGAEFRQLGLQHPALGYLQRGYPGGRD
jgi:hypothetical protein